MAIVAWDQKKTGKARGRHFRHVTAMDGFHHHNPKNGDSTNDWMVMLLIDIFVGLLRDALICIMGGPDTVDTVHTKRRQSAQFSTWRMNGSWNEPLEKEIFAGNNHVQVLVFRGVFHLKQTRSNRNSPKMREDLFVGPVHPRREINRYFLDHWIPWCNNRKDSEGHEAQKGKSGWAGRAPANIMSYQLYIWIILWAALCIAATARYENIFPWKAIRNSLVLPWDGWLSAHLPWGTRWFLKCCVVSCRPELALENPATLPNQNQLNLKDSCEYCALKKT